MSTAPQARPTLRARKKARTREALIATALQMFAEQGFDAVTLDALCDAVDVSKRTFFRTFASKEDVVLAPMDDLWGAFLERLRAAGPGHEPLLAHLASTMLAVLAERRGDAWAEQVHTCRGIAALTPSVRAQGLYVGERTTEAAVDVLRDGAGDPDGRLRARLAVDLLLVAFHRAIDRWAERPRRERAAGLAPDLEQMLDAVAASARPGRR